MMEARPLAPAAALRWAAALALAALLLAQPALARLGALQAMAYWAESVAPALLPFMALMPLLTCDAAVELCRRTLGGAFGALFDLPGEAAPALLIGMLAGSPAGALSARRLAARSGMPRGQLQRVVIAASGFSPAFLLGSVGGEAGGRLLAAQAATQLTLLALTRRLWRDRRAPVDAPASAAEPPVRAAALGVLTVGGWMALFGALAFVLRPVIGEIPANAALCLMDLPAGLRLAGGLPLAEDLRLLLMAALLGFGGLCATCQNFAALRGCGVPAAEFFGMRVPAALTCALFMALDLPGTLRRSAAPFPAAALAAALLALPVVLSLRKSIS